MLRAAAALLETGLDPEQIYLDVYANAPEGRARLLAETLQTMVVEPEHGLAWVTVPPGALERHGATPDDLDGIVEFPRSIAGVRMALLFREIAAGRVKVSLRSVGDVDVADFAKPFGGGGHTKASGLSVEGSIAEAQVTRADRGASLPRRERWTLTGVDGGIHCEWASRVRGGLEGIEDLRCQIEDWTADSLSRQPIADSR